jgi:hypothetical protein
MGELLEALVVLLEVGGHAVEVARELAELVAAAPAEPRAEVAASDRPGGHTQAIQRAEDAAPEHEHREDRETGEQDPEDDRDVTVSVGEVGVGRAQVVASDERRVDSPVAAERRDQHLVVAAVVARLRRPLLARAERVGDERELGRPARLLAD